MSHTQYCLDEIVAEVAAKLDRNAKVKALAQLEEREASGEDVVEVDAQRLRRSLEADVVQHPYVIALDRIAELRALIAAGDALEAGETDNVIDLASARTKLDRSSRIRSLPARRIGRALGGVAIAAACLFALMSWMPVRLSGSHSVSSLAPDAEIGLVRTVNN